ncbi:DNA-binding NarL/FixJ family response regulator [Kribbella sp. VKM Ac-2571]|uniref:response regulator transcription factor n=1 Tax=Kribbella sp. VKM Ac-2571 TaxID=2512222 RepID=UPI001061F0CD|nr:response regulator transcription factor [Kribbella sp. VKM Ac-2571]TDO62483.1 DNA-binding NarL/FixJ family response regulator [Kribbella sp. VKM Ac-2571]
MRIVIGEDSALFREGLSRLLTENGHDVAGTAETADALIDVVRAVDPDLTIIDVRMPPTMTDDGARAAVTLRAERPDRPILMLSQHIETRNVVGLVGTGGFGYLLKDRVLRVGDFLDAMRRVVDGGSALDPAIVAALVTPTRAGDPLAGLSAREREVLALVAEGRSNGAIAAQLVLAERTVESHMRSIFQKLRIDEAPDTHRRVLAVLTQLRQ